MTYYQCFLLCCSIAFYGAIAYFLIDSLCGGAYYGETEEDNSDN